MDDRNQPLQLRRFRTASFDPASFSHREHVRMGFELLRQSSFPRALLTYSEAISRLAIKVNAPQKFNQTITTAFLSLIAEAMSTPGARSFEDLVGHHPELLEKGLLERLYSPDRLTSALARQTFLLPDRRQPA